MGLSNLDVDTGVSFKTRKVNKVSKKSLESSKLIIEKPKPIEKPSKKNIVNDLKALASNEAISYKALINGELLDYDYATDTEVNEVKYKATCLGVGIVVDSNFNPDVISGTMIDSNARLLYFWKKVNDVNDVNDDSKTEELVSNKLLDTIEEDEETISDINTLTDIAEDGVNVDGDLNDLTIEVKQNKEEDLTMTINKEYTQANELLATLKESGDAGVDVLINYCKISFAEVFTKTSNGADTGVVADDLQKQMVYIITQINNNDLLTAESKAKLVEAIEAESVEYQKLLESLTDVTDETKVLLDKKESDDTNWGKIALIVIGTVVAIGAAYSLYRYFEPEDVVLDMSTMSIMNR